MSATPFDQRDGWIWYDGQIVPWKDAQLHVLSHGLHYGSSRVRGRARLWRRDLQVDRAFRAPARNRAQILDFEIPYTVAEIDAAKRLVLQKNGMQRRLSAPGRLARLGDDGRRGSAQQDPPRHRRLGMAELFRPGPEDEGHPPRHGRVPPPRSGDRAVDRQGGRPLHDLHDLQAQGGAEGLCRRADARLAGPRRRMHRRQRVLHPRRRRPHPDRRLLPRRHHPPHGDRSRQAPRLRGRPSAGSCRTSSRASTSASSPARPPK